MKIEDSDYFKMTEKVILFFKSLPCHDLTGVHPIVTKRQVFKVAGLDRSNKDFDRLWRVLIKGDNSQYLVHQGSGKWMYFE